MKLVLEIFYGRKNIVRTFTKIIFMAQKTERLEIRCQPALKQMLIEMSSNPNYFFYGLSSAEIIEILISDAWRFFPDSLKKRNLEKMLEVKDPRDF